MPMKKMLLAMIALLAALAGPARADSPKPAEILKKMTLEEKAGQVIMPGFDGAAFTEKTERILETYKLGGFVLFGGRNITGRAQSAKLAEAVQEKAMAVGAGVPLFLSIDEECGVGSHLNNMTGGVDTPGNFAIAVTDDPVDAYSAYRIMADDMNAFGMNMALAPTLDLMWNKKHPSKNIRTFGGDGEKAARLAAAAVRGFQDGGIIASAKHFPGSGETEIDSHNDTPHNKFSMDLYLKPYRAAVDAGVDVLMLGSEYYDAVDPDHVNNVSKAVITGLARDLLGFKGMILTGSITMSRDAMGADEGELTVQALEAGADMILFAGNAEKDFAAAIEAIKKAVQSGRLSEARLDEAVEYILRLKAKRGLWDSKPTPASDYAAQKERNELTSLNIARRAVNLLINKDNLVPLDRSLGDKILVVSPKEWFTIPKANLFYPIGTSLGTKVKRIAKGAVQTDYDTQTLDRDMPAALEKVKDPNIEVVIFGSVHGYYSQEIVDFAKVLKDTGKKLVVVGMSSPWDAEHMLFADAFVAANNIRGPSIQAAAEVVFGRIPPNENTPVWIEIEEEEH